jgi:CRP-like cAMP-binding protein
MVRRTRPTLAFLTMRLSNTKLATSISPEILSQIEELGEQMSLKPNKMLFQSGEDSDYLYVILEGDIFIEMDSKSPIWIGSGDIIGEIGFILGTKRTKNVRITNLRCTLWRIRRSLIFQSSNLEITILMTHLLVGLAPHLKIRRLEILNDFKSPAPTHFVKPNLNNYCDFDHPSIQQVAKLLRGKDDWESAINIWEFVQSLPYRFGFWHIKASQTLELGFGMCTTKANLQVALLRALNIEAKFGEALVQSKYLSPFLLPAYLAKIKKNIKHYFCLVKLEGQWFRSDASFSREAMQMLAEHYPQQFSHLVHKKFQRGKHFFIEIEEKTMDTLSSIMQKKTFYQSGNHESMNILLDKRQGVSALMPQWVAPILKLLSHNPQIAILRTMAALIIEAEKLHSAIKEQNIASEDYVT